jgi:acetyl-CoA acyltransferase
MTDVYIVDCVRTAIGVGKATGSLHLVHPVTLLSSVLEDLARRNKLDKSLVGDVICGCVTPIKQQGTNIPRIALLKAGYPIEVPGVQLNRMCGSGQQAIHFASQAIASGDLDIAIGCGVEMMGVVQMGTDSLPECFTMNPNVEQKFSFGDFPFKLLHQGVSAEMIAEKYKITRKELDEFAIESHKKCSIAIKEGRFKSQIVGIEAPQKDGSKKVVLVDEGIKYPVDVQKLESLNSPFKKGGVVTAATSSQVSDGAAAVLLASGRACDKYGLKKRGKIVARIAIGSDVELMLDGVIPATQAALKKAGLTIDDIDVFEINEAFGSVVLAWQKTLKVPFSKINPNGGAIAHGHPLGASGAVLMTKLLNELERSGKRYGLQTMCIGHGQATATIIENCSWKGKSKL